MDPGAPELAARNQHGIIGTTGSGFDFAAGTTVEAHPYKTQTGALEFEELESETARRQPDCHEVDAPVSASELAYAETDAASW